VLGRFSLGPKDGGWSDNFLYFVPDYARAPQYHYDAKIPSSEIWLAAVAVGWADEFDIRQLGALQGALFVLAFWALVVALRAYGLFVQAVVGAVALFVFCDVRYVAQLNSCYADTAAMLGLGLMATVVCRRIGYPAFTFAALLLICSKAQHGIYGIVPAVWLLMNARRSRMALPCGALLLAATAWIVTSTPHFYQGQALFNRIFFRILKTSPSPAPDAKELGVLESEFRFIGKHSFDPGNPVDDQLWLEGFRQRTGYLRMAKFYLRHPLRTAGYMIEDLRVESPQMRPENLSNFRKIDCHPPGARTNRFAAWTNLRSTALRLFPEHLIVWYAGVICACLFLIGRPAGRVCLVLAVTGILEFGVATLADALETYRHLFLFHMMTDITVCFAAGWLAHSGARIMTEPAIEE
jgi:hypothetical protein